MDQRRAVPADKPGPYLRLRQDVDDACGRVAPTRSAAEAARAELTETRRALARVQRALDEARTDLDPGRIAHAKASAHSVYRTATRDLDDDVPGLQRATVEW